MPPNDFDDDDDLADTLIKQFPKPSPEPPSMETEALEDVYYPDGPPVVIPVSLLKTKYSNRLEALIRARELCSLRGLRFVRMFETGRAWVAHCYRQNKEA
jgi:hypothetical protein